jgi:hypothetical protein
VLCKPSATFSDIDHFLRRETCGERWGYGDHMSSLKITQNDVKPFEVNYDRLDLMKARGASTAELDQMMALSKLSRGWECVLNPTDFYQVRCVSMHCVASVFWVRGPHTAWCSSYGPTGGGTRFVVAVEKFNPIVVSVCFPCTYAVPSSWLLIISRTRGVHLLTQRRLALCPDSRD